jgi:asparagine synthase (glutamine-hydrolysing)
MCGIAGIAAGPNAQPPDPDRLEAMCESLRHRGPDDAGVDILGGVGLGIRRLAIIDVLGGRQPYFNENGSVRAVFNGEIYNYRELRSGLERLGHRFRTLADGEVIVHLWEEYGADFPTHLNGMFSIALHDAEQDRLVLVRDRIGIKPLYYHYDGRQLVFGSEIKALFASGLVERSLDIDAIGQFLAWEYVPAPRTLFRGVQKLEPGELLCVAVESERCDRQRWWELPVPDSGEDADRPAADWEEAVQAALATAVQRQSMADVPLGAFLSGGVDSSLVVANMDGAHTFSIGFTDPSYSELEWAKRVAAHLGVSHEFEVLTPDVCSDFEKLMPFMDDPIGDSSVFPTYLLCRYARSHVKVCLSGDGGDELFGGYETYSAQALNRTWRRLPAPVRGALDGGVRRLRPRPAKKGWVNRALRFVQGTGEDEALAHARWRLFAGEAVREQLFTPEAQASMATPVGDHINTLFGSAGSRDGVNQQLYVDLRSYLPDNCLLKVDRMSMACSLEVRVPFLDHELVELAFRLPGRLKVRLGRTKYLLKRIAASHVPPDCVYRSKEGFSSPVKRWLNDELRERLEAHLAPARLRREGIIDDRAAARLIREHAAGSANHSHLLWSLLVLQDWRDRWAM